MRGFLFRFQRFWLAGVLGLTSALALTLMLTGVASAHASYVSSNPEAGAVLATAPTQVTIYFAENVNPAGKDGIPSSIQVFLKPELKNTFYSDQDAILVSTGATQFPLSNAKSMSIAMKGAGDGIYEVYWHTVSADDGDADSGVFFFGVGKGNVLGVGSVAPAASSPTSSGVPIWAPILVGVLALLVGGGAGAWLTRRMSLPEVEE